MTDGRISEHLSYDRHSDKMLRETMTEGKRFLLAEPAGTHMRRTDGGHLTAHDKAALTRRQNNI
jgi:hypothetical protein